VRRYNLFISHSWSYSAAYENLVGLLSKAQQFEWADYSVPREDPVHMQSDARLYQAILQRMQLSDVVIVMAGVYSTYQRWIQSEIRAATRDLSKPIIAVRPVGSARVSRIVQEHADRVVEWNPDSVVSAIREVAVAQRDA
jgi:hypothetical protein